MKIAFLTTDDPLYLPEFFSTVLDRRARDTQAVYVVPPLYRKQTPFDAAWRYYRSFGIGVTWGLAWRVAQSKAKRRSIAGVCEKRMVLHEMVTDVNAPEFLKGLREDAPDVLVSVSCPQIFKKPLMTVAPMGILNIHGAILPQYRGVMPSFWMMANRENQAGVSIYFVNEEIDAGSLCAQKKFDIGPEETLDQFLRRSKRIAAELLLNVLDQLESGEIDRHPLDLSQGSYYSWPDAGAYRRFREVGRQFW